MVRWALSLSEASSNNIENQVVCCFMIIALKSVNEVSPSNRACRSHSVDRLLLADGIKQSLHETQQLLSSVWLTELLLRAGRRSSLGHPVLWAISSECCLHSNLLDSPSCSSSAGAGNLAPLCFVAVAPPLRQQHVGKLVLPSDPAASFCARLARSSPTFTLLASTLDCTLRLLTVSTASDSDFETLYLAWMGLCIIERIALSALSFSSFVVQHFPKCTSVLAHQTHWTSLQATCGTNCMSLRQIAILRHQRHISPTFCLYQNLNLVLLFRLLIVRVVHVSHGDVCRLAQGPRSQILAVEEHTRFHLLP